MAAAGSSGQGVYTPPKHSKMMSFRNQSPGEEEGQHSALTDANQKLDLHFHL